MNDHLTLAELSDVLDGAMASADARAAAAHLESCARCRDELTRLRGVVAAASSLPKSVEPPPELWNEIRRTLEAGKIAHLGARSGGRAARWWTPLRAWAVAATVMLVATSVLAGRLLTESRRNPPEMVASSASQAVERIDLHYTPSLNQLTASLLEHSATTPRKTIASVNHSLEIVDSAIAETRAALIQDPANRGIAELLSANYQRKVDLLKRASELATEF